MRPDQPKMVPTLGAPCWSTRSAGRYRQPSMLRVKCSEQSQFLVVDISWMFTSQGIEICIFLVMIMVKQSQVGTHANLVL